MPPPCITIKHTAFPVNTSWHLLAYQGTRMEIPSQHCGGEKSFKALVAWRYRGISYLGIFNSDWKRHRVACVKSTRSWAGGQSRCSPVVPFFIISKQLQSDSVKKERTLLGTFSLLVAYTVLLSLKWKEITQGWGVKVQATCKYINAHMGTQANVDIGCSAQKQSKSKIWDQRKGFLRLRKPLQKEWREISKCWVDGFTKLSQWSFPTLMIPWFYNLICYFQKSSKRNSLTFILRSV